VKQIVVHDLITRCANTFEMALCLMPAIGSGSAQFHAARERFRRDPFARDVIFNSSTPGWTNVNVLLLVDAEVFPTEGPILALRLVDHRDMWRYLRFVDQRVEVSSRAIGHIAREPFGLDVEALLDAFDHGLARAPLRARFVTAALHG
jgi:hypothetical protein